MNFSEEEEKEIVNLMDVCYSDDSFLNELYSKYLTDCRKLSICEIYILEEIFKKGRLHFLNQYEIYKTSNPIVYTNDQEIYSTIFNLFFGELIFQLLTTRALDGVKQRQCGYIVGFNEENNGLISNGDKAILIHRLRLECTGLINKIQKIAKRRFLEVKINLALFPDQNPFESFACFNTNISASEILGLNEGKIKRKI